MAEKFKKKKNILRSFDEGSKGEQIVMELLRGLGHKVEKSTGGLVHDLVVNDKIHIEVKYDLMSRKTGNLAIEYHNSKKDTPSGINATTAEFWFHIVFDKDGNQSVLFAYVPRLKQWAKETKPLKTIKAGGDDNADLYIFPITMCVDKELGCFTNISDNDDIIIKSLDIYFKVNSDGNTIFEQLKLMEFPKLENKDKV